MATPTPEQQIETTQALAEECSRTAAAVMAAMLTQPVASDSGTRYFTTEQAFELTKIFLKLALDEAGLTS